MSTSNRVHSRRAFIGRAAGAAWAATLLQTGRDPLFAEALDSIRASAATAAVDEEKF